MAQSNKTTSGRIRMSLGSTKRFLSERLKTADSVLNEQIPEDAHERWMHLKKAEEIVKLLQKSLKKISELETDFEKSCETLNDEEQEKESENWATLADGDDGYLYKVDLADEKIAALETKVQEIDHLMFGASQYRASSPASPVHSAINVLSASTNAQNAPRQFAVKPPKLELPEFSGDVLKWNEFWTVFKSNIHDRPDLTGVEKFTYLKQKLKGAAKKSVDGLVVNDVSYQAAIDILHDRFDKKDAHLLSKLYGQLTSLPPSGDRIDQKRDTYDECERIFRQIEAAGGDLSHNNNLTLAYISKFPVHFYKELRKDYKVDLQIPLSEARKAVHKYLEELESAFSDVGDLLTAQGVKKRPPPNNGYGSGSPNQNGRRPGTERPGINRPFNRNDGRFTGQQSFGSIARQPPSSCYFCGGSHYNSDCSAYPTARARVSRLEELGRCTRCGQKHFQNHGTCKRSIHCQHCNNFDHWTAVCVSKYPNKPKGTGGIGASGGGSKPDQSPGNKKRQGDPASAAVTPISMSNNISARKFTSLFQTARIQVINLASNRTISARLCLDTLSNRSYVTDSVADELGLQHHGRDHLYVSVFGTKDAIPVPTRYVEFGIMLRNGSVMQIQANTTKLINASSILPDEWPEEERLELERMKESGGLADDPFDEDKSIDILIGADYVWDILCCQTLSPLNSPGKEIRYIPTKLGIMLAGRISNESRSDDQSSMALLCITEPNFDHCFTSLQHDPEYAIQPEQLDIDAYWKLENMGIHDSPVQSDDEIAQKQFDRSVSYIDNRYFVEWTWIPEKKERLPTNFSVAHRRLKSLTKRLKCDPKLLHDYNQIITLQEDRGIIERVDASKKCDHKLHYLPHHPVIKPHRETTKVRIVYDASSKESKNDVSLNECFFRGPVIMPDLCKMLMRFRLKRIGIIADIEKAFLQVGLLPSERDVTRFLWYRDPKHPDYQDYVVYRFCRVVFGIICSPFLLAATIQHHLAKSDTSFSRRLMQEVYVDNIISGADDEIEACQYHGLAKDLFASASMRLQQYCSNSQTFMEQVPEADCVKSTDNRVLGMQWDSAGDDTLRLSHSNNFWSKPSEHKSKRSILKAVASIFDPLGFFQPVTFKAKLFLQNLWIQAFDWDKKLDGSLRTAWKAIHTDIEDIFQIRIPRFIGTATEDSMLAVFCDASKKGYGAVVYLVSHSKTSSVSNIIFSKSRLSIAHQNRKPHSVTIPRLELLGAVVGAQISQFCREALKPDLKVHFFCDSKCVLYWLQTNTDTLKRFVARRVESILKLENCDYHYVCTDENPADFLTKGKTAKEIMDCELWWHGPKWLTFPTNQWPSDFPVFTEEMRKEAHKEQKKCEIFHTFSILESSPNGPLSVNLGDISNLQRLIRVTATCLIAVKRLIWVKLPSKTALRHPRLVQLLENVSSELPVVADDFEASLQLWIKFHQSHHFAEAMGAILSGNRHPLVSQLGLKLDQHGIIRSHSRFSHADLPEATIKPILLSPKTKFSELIVNDIHVKTGHVGVAHTLSEVRKTYWIPHGRAFVKSVLHRCIICRKYKSSKHYALPDMPPWPVERVSKSVPFEFCGIDYFGPVKVKLVGDLTKMWACLFTCLVTRAVHLEPVCDYSSVEFLHCLRRFFSRRGFPKQIISDNAAQFRLTKILAEQAWKAVPLDESVISYSASHNIRWKFITELAPWQGGHYERLVGVVKSVLRTTIGRRLLSWTDFVTLLTEAEAIVNSRPITYVGSDLDSSNAVITPADFLAGLPTDVGSGDADFAIKDLSEGARLLSSIWKRRKMYLDKLWRLWYDHYLLALRERSSPEHRRRKGAHFGSPSVGEVVLLRDEDLPRGSWKLARVTKILPSSDGKVRSVELKLPNGSTIRRAVNFLVPLEIGEAEGQISNQVPVQNAQVPQHSRDDTASDDDDFFGFTPTDVQRTIQVYQLHQD